VVEAKPGVVQLQLALIPATHRNDVLELLAKQKKGTWYAWYW